MSFMLPCASLLTRTLAFSAAMGSTGCQPISGTDLLSSFDLERRSKWASLGYAALTFPALCLCFYLGVRNVRHERR
jgi:hypothetical protein